jgi:hypothetical protein
MLARVADTIMRRESGEAAGLSRSELDFVLVNADRVRSQIIASQEEHQALRNGIRDREAALQRELADERKSAAVTAAHHNPEVLQQQWGPRSARGTRGGTTGGSSVGMRPANRSDLMVRPLSNRNVPSRVPKVINAVVWDMVKVRSSITTNTSSIVETNYSWQMTTHPEYTSWATLYDQWCIPQVSVTFTSQEAPGSTNQLPEIHTALDFDNVANIGAIQSIDEYQTCAVVTLQPGKSYTRSIKPCIKLAGSNTTSQMVGREWCDMGAVGSSWNGIRSICATAAGGTNLIIVETTLWYAFRNGI